MATIANLSIGLSADSARLKKDLNKADAATKKWGSKQKKTFAGVTKAVRGCRYRCCSHRCIRSGIAWHDQSS